MSIFLHPCLGELEYDSGRWTRLFNCPALLNFDYTSCPCPDPPRFSFAAESKDDLPSEELVQLSKGLLEKFEAVSDLIVDAFHREIERCSRDGDFIDDARDFYENLPPRDEVAGLLGEPSITMTDANADLSIPHAAIGFYAVDIPGYDGGVVFLWDGLEVVKVTSF